MDLDLANVPRRETEREDFILFSETQSRFVVTVAPKDRGPFESLLGDAVFGLIGAISQGDIFRVKGLKGQPLIEASIDDLKEAWQRPLRF